MAFGLRQFLGFARAAAFLIEPFAADELRSMPLADASIARGTAPVPRAWQTAERARTMRRPDRT